MAVQPIQVVDAIAKAVRGLDGMFYADVDGTEDDHYVIAAGDADTEIEYTIAVYVKRGGPS